MKVSCIHLLICFIFSFAEYGLTADATIALKRQAVRDGFHRDLQTTLTIHKNDLKMLPGVSCCVLLVETLPSGLYVDTFQLENQAALGGPKVLTHGTVDIEAPAYLSRSHELFVYTTLPDDTNSSQDSISVSVSLPVHVRYHKPAASADVTHVTLSFVHPQVLLNCSAQESKTVLAPCGPENPATCSWTEIHYETEGEYLEMKVPVGREQDVRVVVCCTLVVTVLGCTFLLYVITYYDKWRVKPKDS